MKQGYSFHAKTRHIRRTYNSARKKDRRSRGLKRKRHQILIPINKKSKRK